MSDPRKLWRSAIGGPLLGVLAVACCLAGPLIIGAAGTLTAGAVFGLVAAAAVLLVLCLSAARHLTSDRGC